MTDQEFYDAQAEYAWLADGYDDNAGVDLGNATATSPVISNGSGQKGVSSWAESFLNLIGTGLQAASTAYVATTNAEAARNNRRPVTGSNPNLPVLFAFGLAAVLGLVLVLRRN